jgi:exodeoxyribonuclease-3
MEDTADTAVSGNGFLAGRKWLWMFTVRVATWNVNSLRARLPRVLEWLTDREPDVLCLQETKVTDELFPGQPLEDLGYSVVMHGQKTYNGVAIVSRKRPQDVVAGLGQPAYDAEARCLRARIDGVQFVNVYVPNGQSVGSEKFEFKLGWLAALHELLRNSDVLDEPLVVCGDFNVTRDDLDVHDPQRWRGQILCSDPEREALAALLALPLDDALRSRNPQGGVHTWWDYRAGAFHRGWGLRIDHILQTAAMAERMAEIFVDRPARKGKAPSDHAPVVADYR